MVVRSCRNIIWDWYYTNETPKLVRVEFDARSGGAFSLHSIPVLFAGRAACDSNYHTKQLHIGHVRCHHFINIIILTFELLLPGINLRPSRTKMTPQTSNMVSNRPYFDVLAAKLLLVAYSRSRGHTATLLQNQTKLDLLIEGFLRPNSSDRLRCQKIRYAYNVVYWMKAMINGFP